MAEKIPFHAKMFAVRSSITTVKKQRTNDHFGSSYFDINDTLRMLNPILQENKLLLKQPVKGNRVYSIIQDVEPNDDGEFDFEDSYLDLPGGLTPQKIGSAITYFRRYTLVALLGLEAEDDDGNLASGHKSKPAPGNVKQVKHKKQPPQRAQSPARATNRQKPKPWLNLSNRQTGEVTQQYWEVYNYKKIHPDFTKEQLLAQYRVNTREKRYLDEIFN